MTLKEKMCEYLPDHVDEDFEGGVIGCPEAYIKLRGHFKKKCDDVDTCEKCWSQEYIEDLVPITLQKVLKAIADMCDERRCHECPLFEASHYGTNKCLINYYGPPDYTEKVLPYLPEEPIPLELEE